MPVSHLSLTVSHLPTSCSFYLAALQPLGYRYVGQHNNHIGFGVDEADFFICQDSPGVKPGAAHIAFNAPSRAAVDAFFTAALKAGGSIHDGPALRDPATGYYSAAIVDFDGNAVEVVHRDTGDQTSVVPAPQKRAVEPVDEAPHSVANETSHRSPLRTIVNNIVATTTTFTMASNDSNKSSKASSALVGTLLGAAAGAAFAYAMVISEHPAPPKEPEVKRSQTVYQTIEAPPTPRSVASVSSNRSRRHSPSYSNTSSHRIRMIEAPPSPVSDVSSPSTVRPRSIRAIEAPPPAPFPPSIHSSSRVMSEAFSPTMPPPPSAETYYTIDVDSEEHTPSHISRSSRRTTTTARSHRSRRASLTSPSSSHRSRPRPIVTATSSIASALNKAPADFPLPASAFSMPFTRAPSSAHKSRANTHASESARTADIPLPVSAKTSAYVSVSRPSSSASPRTADISLPASTKTSYVTTHTTAPSPSNPYSQRSSRSRRDGDKDKDTLAAPESIPLPPSAKTSFISRAPTPPRSRASRASQATVKPSLLTKANLASRGVRKAATDIDDGDSVAPSDSISQVSEKERRVR